MAVPKKRTSRSKSRKFYWRKKALLTSQKSLSLARSIVDGKSTTFIYNQSLDRYRNTDVT